MHCPPGCPFLSKHQTYQEKRTIEKTRTSTHRRSPSDKDMLRDERMAWLAIHAEYPLKNRAANDRSFTDKDCITALNYAIDKLERGQARIFLPNQNPVVSNETGEAVFQSLEACRYQKRIILPGESDGYTDDEKLKCLERIIQSVTDSADINFSGRKYVDQLLSRFEKIEQFSGQQKIT